LSAGRPRRGQTGKGIQLVIVEDRRLFRELYGLAFEGVADIEVVAGLGEFDIDRLCELMPDVILAGISISHSYALEMFPKIKNACPGVKILILAPDLIHDSLSRLIRAGAKGYISTKSACVADLINAVKALSRGEIWLNRKAIATFLDDQYDGDSVTHSSHNESKDVLTPREQEILCCIGKGCSNKEIGSMLFISEKTVKTHINSIFRKLNVSRRIEALLIAIKRGIVQPHEVDM